jgi:putative endonuclease
VSGAVSYRSGLAAEERVALHYGRAGAAIVRRRWRCRSGEIDLVVRERDGVTVFVEVKAAASHAGAAERLGAAQMQRILRAAEEYLATEPAGSLTPMRIDVALVDAAGRVEILENALAG